MDVDSPPPTAPLEQPVVGSAQHSIPLPPPPPAPHQSVAAEPVVANPFEWVEPPLRAGQLADGWRTLFITGWVCVIAALGCMWQVSRQIGLAMWWIGPEAEQRSFLVIAIPFVGPAAVVASAVWNRRWAVYLGLAVAGITSVIALGDRQYPGLLLGELAIATFALLISLACLAGRMRRPTSAVPGEAAPTPTIP